jgi:nicotinate-nucleotide--dimethylbenzimidazole phosphoribosyltransferase
MPALILASSVAAAGLLVFLGMLYAPSGAGLSPKPPGEIVSPSTSPLPVVPQADVTRGTPMKSESSDAEPRGDVVEERSSLSQGAAETPAGGKATTLGKNLPTISPMDTPRKPGAVEEGVTQASAPRDEPKEAPPVPKTDTESTGGYQHVPPQELKKEPPKVSAQRSSGKGREKATPSGPTRGVPDTLPQPPAEEGTKGSGKWYIKK